MLKKVFGFIFSLGLLACLHFPNVANATSTEDGLEIKYLYYWDRNEAWNHTPAFSFFKKLSTSWKLSWNQELDMVSGASRRLGWKNIGTLGDNQIKLDGLSSASKREIRHSEQATVAYSHQGRNASASFYFSDERDYRSYSPALSISWDFNDRNTTLGASAALFLDELRPVGSFAALGGERKITSGTLSVTQVLAPLRIASLTVNSIHSTGVLGHPYNPIITSTGNLVLENLPDRRTTLAISGKLIQGFSLFQQLGSVHVEARHYRDDWNMVSNTIDAQWYQYVADGTWFRLRTRGYRQGAAAFALTNYDGSEVYRSPDIRYYAFSTLTVGVKLGSAFSERWGESALLPDRWDLSYDHGLRDTKGEMDGINPTYRYQLFSPDEYYMQGTFMAGLGFDF